MMSINCFESPPTVEMDEMWSFVHNKENQRWLWHAIDHTSGEILAYIFGSRKDDVFRQLQALLVSAFLYR